MATSWRVLAAAGVCSIVSISCSGGGTESGSTAPVVTGNSVMFVTQVPLPADFATVVSTFGNHQSEPRACPRGGDLWIRYPDGTLRNLTEAAGFGNEGLQGASSIAVREPCVHWSGTKAVFSLLLGSPAQYQATPNPWQLYEITGFGPGEQPSITKVPYQPEGFDNVSPCYASDDRILFTSARPRNGAAHLHPQLDEYEEAPTVTGLWSLDTETGALFLLQQSPSGSFSPRVDSFGRVVYTRWDHLERDQQADDDHIGAYLGSSSFGTFNWSDESAGATHGPSVEVFPEPRQQWIAFVDTHPSYAGPQHGWAPYLVGNSINHFFPWTIQQDGTEEETLNHVGRHELHSYFDAARDDDPSITTFTDPTQFTANYHPIQNMLQIREDPLEPGSYIAVDAPEFFTHAAGQVIRLRAAPGVSPDAMVVDYITPKETSSFTDHPTALHTGLYRNPLPMSDGQWIVSHTTDTKQDEDIGSASSPRSRYEFRLKLLEQNGDYKKAGAKLTPGISKSVTWYSPDQLLSYNGVLWELDAVEVVARPVPVASTTTIGGPELQVLADEGVTPVQLKNWLRSQDLALVVSRNVTRRDRNDRQQPYNLRVAGTPTQTIGSPGTVYDVAHMQFFQADQLRGLTFNAATPIPGRRVIAQPMHDPAAQNPANPGGPPASVALGSDGSMAALVPAQRAMTWQLTDPEGEAVVRERYWVTFQPGEVRTCVACHGLSSADQANQPAPTNKPQALGTLLQFLKARGSL
jgi:hypothetical protein